MRHMRIWFTLVLFLGVTSLAFARIAIKVKSVGFDGYYRPHTIVPILVQVENTGETVQGEFRVTAPGFEDALTDTYRTHVTIPKGAKQPIFLYVVPRAFSRNFAVSFTTGGGSPQASTFKRCQELYGSDRLLLVVGGTPKSLYTVSGQSIRVSELVTARPWDIMSTQYQYSRYGYGYPGGGGGSGSGQVRLVYADPALLPDNPEAYAAVDTLALMANVTENTLSTPAQKAIPVWTANGGHLLIADSPVRSRLDAAFYAQFLQAPAPAMPVKALATPYLETSKNVDGGLAQTRNYGSGHVTKLNYDPDTTTSSDWNRMSAFYGKLIERHQADAPLTNPLRETLNTAVMVRNLKPPNLRLIIIFLLIYLVMLVPVNYFVLKKMDKRELAWVTTPIIVLLFTFGAYGIGYITKGHRLVTNVVSVIETMAGQTDAEAVSQLLIFSPSRTRYRLSLGADAMVARELTGWGEESPYDGRSRDRSEPLYYNNSSSGLLIERLQVNMWAFRQLVTAHEVSMGKGFSSTLAAVATSTYGAPTATGGVTNGTPYDFAVCELYLNGNSVGAFTMKPGETVNVKSLKGDPAPKLHEQEQYMLDTLRVQSRSQLFSSERMRQGFVLVGYSVDPAARVSLKVNDRPASSAMTMVVAHL